MISIPKEVNDTFAILTTYVGETGRTLQKWIEEHKSAVRRGDEKNGIAVDVKKTQHDTNYNLSITLSLSIDGYFNTAAE